MHHSADGSAGLVLNRPTTKRVGHPSASGVAVPREASRGVKAHGRGQARIAPPLLSACQQSRNLPPGRPPSGPRAPPAGPCCYHPPHPPHPFASAQGLDDGPFNSRVYWGGPTEDGALLLLHGDPSARLQGSLDLGQGMYLELSRLAVARVASGDMSRVRGCSMSCAVLCCACLPFLLACLRAACLGRCCLRRWQPSPHACLAHRPCPGLLQGTLRFFSGCCTWGPGELERQVAGGAWAPTAASRSLVLKHAAQLPQGLWHELSCMLGSQAGAACQP